MVTKQKKNEPPIYDRDRKIPKGRRDSKEFYGSHGIQTDREEQGVRIRIIKR